MSWLRKLFSGDNEASTKRFVCVLLVVVLVVAMFLLMYIKIQIANEKLVDKCLDNLFWLILFFGGFITIEQFIKKWQPAGPKNIVQQDVKEQTVINTDQKTGL